MDSSIDLRQLSLRESEQVEWKENVADIDDVIATLAAFANDLANLGGGYVVCGAAEGKDEHGFPSITMPGLTADRLKELEGKILTRCRERVHPPITPTVEEISAATAERRILVFIQPATTHAHSFRGVDGSTKHFVRVSRSTVEARNGVLRDLLVRKKALEPWDRRSCSTATMSDLDLLALRDALQRMGVFSPERGVEPYLSDAVQLSPFVPPLCVREPLSNILRPRNFAMLLFGRDIQRHIPGAFSIFSVYSGVDRSDRHAERHELASTLIEQAKRLTELLNIQAYTAFDKADTVSPNAVKYPTRALYEAMGNALAHRDYEDPGPVRITVFSDRIEVLSPGPLPLGVDTSAFREGRADPRWRNQTLAWFFNRLQIAQAEGQGIPTIIRVMREEGNPPPTLDAYDDRVVCVLPAHPRHALLQEIREAEESLALGALQRAQTQVQTVLQRDPQNHRALQLFAEVQQAFRDGKPIEDFLAAGSVSLEALPPKVLVDLAEALVLGDPPSRTARSLAAKLLRFASRGRIEERELRQIALALIRANDSEAALELLNMELRTHPEWEQSASLRQLRGDALLGLAKQCRSTGSKSSLPPRTRQRAWEQFHLYLDRAEVDLRRALVLSVDPGLVKIIRRNLEYAEKLRKQHGHRGGRK